MKERLNEGITNLVVADGYNDITAFKCRYTKFASGVLVRATLNDIWIINGELVSFSYLFYFIFIILF